MNFKKRSNFHSSVAISHKNYEKFKTYVVECQYESGYNFRLRFIPDRYCDDNHVYVFLKGKYWGGFPIRYLKGKKYIIYG